MRAVGFAHRDISTAIGITIEVDGEHRRGRSDEDVAMIGTVDFQDLVIDEVLPAMIVEVLHCLVPHCERTRLRVRSTIFRGY